MGSFSIPLDTGCSLRRKDGTLAAAATGLDQARRMSKRTVVGTLFPFFSGSELRHLYSVLVRGTGFLMLPIP